MPISSGAEPLHLTPVQSQAGLTLLALQPVGLWPKPMLAKRRSRSDRTSPGSKMSVVSEAPALCLPDSECVLSPGAEGVGFRTFSNRYETDKAKDHGPKPLSDQEIRSHAYSLQARSVLRVVLRESWLRCLPTRPPYTWRCASAGTSMLRHLRVKTEEDSLNFWPTATGSARAIVKCTAYRP